VMGLPMAGRALRCPPSEIARGIKTALPKGGGQGTARPTIRDWRISLFSNRLLNFMLWFD
jgi:hypothetical protein